MRKTVLSLVMLFMMGTVSVFAGSKTTEVKVSGNCGMCEERIETAAKSIDGVSEADWNKDTNVLAVTYDDSKTSIDKVQSAIVKAGHDTGSYTADSDTYNNLPGCCKYDRASVDKSAKSSCNHCSSKSCDKCKK